MYKYFNKIITKELCYNWCEEYKTYTSLSEVEIDSLNKLIEFAADSSNSQLHIDFIQSYKLMFQNHVSYVKSVMESMEQQSEELLKILNESDGVEGIFNSINLGFYWNVDIDTIYFFKPLEYDHYLKSQSFIIIEVVNTPKGYKVQQHTLGFTTKDVNEMINEPSFIKKQIEKFSTIDNLEEIYSHIDYCKNLLVKLFGVRKFSELVKIEDSTAVKLLGNPLEIFREISGISKYKIIELSLPQRLKDKFNEEIVELIEVEVKINNKDDYKEIFEEQFKEYCESLYSRKMKLMNSLSFQQKQLDEYISYLPKEFY